MNKSDVQKQQVLFPLPWCQVQLADTSDKRQYQFTTLRTILVFTSHVYVVFSVSCGVWVKINIFFFLFFNLNSVACAAVYVWQSGCRTTFPLMHRFSPQSILGQRRRRRFHFTQKVAGCVMKFACRRLPNLTLKTHLWNVSLQSLQSW